MLPNFAEEIGLFLFLNKTMEITIDVTKEELKFLAENNMAMTIAVQAPVKIRSAIVNERTILFVVIQSISSGEKGCMSVLGCEVVPVKEYKGNLNPLTYSEHMSLVKNGERKRDYPGMKIHARGSRAYVFINNKLKFIQKIEK